MRCQRWLLPPQAGGSFDDTRPLVIRKIGPEPLQINGRTYPGSLVLFPTQPFSDNQFDLVNHVSIEQYLPGVLDSELPDNWAPAAYLAQAITARSYALVQIRRFGVGRHYDLVSSPASQAYRGITQHAMSRIAVRDTAGLVLSWNNQILPGYYSSTCGGVGQSPREAFGSSTPPRPLIPRYDHPHWCRSSRHYRWGPIKRDLKTLSARWRAWGKHHNRPIQQLSTIRSIVQAQRNPGGRVIRFEIQDDKGNRFTLLSDSLRSASNFSSSSLKIPPPPANQRLKSGYVEVKILGGVVVFPEGRGYGHGVGLCQYGAQAMAASGKDPIEILAEYFPQAKVERAY